MNSRETWISVTSGDFDIDYALILLPLDAVIIKLSKLQRFPNGGSRPGTGPESKLLGRLNIFI